MKLLGIFAREAWLVINKGGMPLTLKSARQLAGE